MEKIVARRLAYLAGKQNLIPSTQFGGLPNRSTSDAILTFVNDIQAAWTHGKVTTALTFDIKGYFDFVNHNRLINILRTKRIPLPMVRWTASFLEGREAAICLDGTRGEMKAVENGIPQGSPVSPILAAFYSAELLETFEIPKTQGRNRISLPDDPTPTTLLMYVDDGKIYVSSDSLETNIWILQRAYARTETWLESVGLSIDKSKRELMHYTRRKKDNCPAIRLQNADGTVSTIVPGSYVKWLGVQLDRKLRFDHHVKTLAARAENTVNGLTMLANTVRGLSQVHLRQLYKTCVVPVMTYASAAWWTGKKTHAKSLERVQNRALRLICAAFRTTQIHALQIEASIPPIHLTLDLELRRAACRFNKLSTQSPILQRLPDEWRSGRPPRTPPPCKPRGRAEDIRPSTQLQKLAQLTSHRSERIFPYLNPPWRRTGSSFGDRIKINGKDPGKSKEDAAKDHLEKLKELTTAPHLVMYTDGSQRTIHQTRRVGAGVAIYHEGREVKARSCGLGAAAEVYDGELAGLMLAA